MNLRNAPLTIALLVVNLAIYAAQFVSGNDAFLRAGAIVPDAVQRGEYYRILTAGFLHFTPMHIAFNMYALAQAGMAAENLYGTPRYFVIYFGALIAGGIAAFETTIGTPTMTAGASGAIMGLFGALAALGLKTPGLRRVLLNWALFPIVATLAVGFTTQGISNAGHLGGLLAGAILGYVFPAARLRALEPED